MIVQAGVIHHKPRIAILGTITQQSAVPRGDENHHRWTKEKKKKQRSTRGRGKRAAGCRSGQQASQTAIWVRDFQGPQRTKKPPPTYLSRTTEREREREEKPHSAG